MRIEAYIEAPANRSLFMHTGPGGLLRAFDQGLIRPAGPWHRIGVSWTEKAQLHLLYQEW